MSFASAHSSLHGHRVIAPLSEGGDAGLKQSPPALGLTLLLRLSFERAVIAA